MTMDLTDDAQKTLDTSLDGELNEVGISEVGMKQSLIDTQPARIVSDDTAEFKPVEDEPAEPSPAKTSPFTFTEQPLEPAQGPFISSIETSRAKIQLLTEEAKAMDKQGFVEEQNNRVLAATQAAETDNAYVSQTANTPDLRQRENWWSRATARFVNRSASNQGPTPKIVK